MVRTGLRLAGKARRALGRAVSTDRDAAEPTPEPPATKAPAKKAPAKKATAKKAPAKKAPAKKAPAKKAPARKSTARKSTATKAPAARPTAVEVPGLSREDLAEIVADLEAQRRRSTELVTTHEGELASLLSDSGDGAGHDQADVGASFFERDQEYAVLTNERDKLAQIEHALERIEDGSYGVCESCGEPIGPRLTAFPRATLCVPCKQREERR